MGYETSEITDDAFVRKTLWEIFPEVRYKILELESEEAEILGEVVEVGMYTLASDVFVNIVLQPLVQGEHFDQSTASRCAELIERLLGSGRMAVREMVSIRITDYLLGYVEPWLKFKNCAGPLLRREVDERKKYYTGPF